jgi:uncharacterized protein YjcR
MPQYRADAVEPTLRRRDPVGHTMSVARRRRQKTLSHAGGAPGSGAPRGNKNALKHGAYTQEAIERRKGIREFIRRSQDLIAKK